jgi:dipeptidyl aminopeptidase/acylaminoacyl peptidase
MLALLASILISGITVEDAATMPQLSTPRWSPDGTHIAYVVSRADLKRSVYEGDVWLTGVESGVNIQLTREGNDNTPRWSPDGKRIAFLSDRSGPSQIYAIDIAGGEATQVTHEPTAIRFFEWSPDGTRIAFTRGEEPTSEEQARSRERNDARVFGESRTRAHLYVIDVKSGAVRRLTFGAFAVIAVSWLGDEVVISRATGVGLDDLYRTDIYAVSEKDGTMRPIVARPGWDHGPSVSPDGKWIAYTSTGAKSTGDARDWVIEHDLYVIPAAGGAERKLATAYGRTPESHAWSGDSRTVWFDGPWNTTSPIFRASVDGATFEKVHDGMHADIDVHGGSVASICQSMKRAPEVCVDGHPITDHNGVMRLKVLGETRLIKWKSDGYEIEGLLTLPAGYRAGQRVPLITFLHGGPASNFSQSFLGYVGSMFFPHQVLAEQGFAVLRPNPRGSGGYGVDFRRGPINDWMNGPWRDVEAGIDKLIADGIADPKRLGLAGWSYGGYLAAAALSKTDRFRAVSIGAPVVDLFTHHLTSDIRDYIPAYYPGLPLELLRAHSPLQQLKKTSANVLIFQGENDERVPPAQSIMLYHRLRELGANVTLVMYPRSAHGTREPKLRIDMMRRNVDFFGKHLR